jgi:group I intron endonuclease
MVNYQNGKIYKLVNDIDDDIYVGSTCKQLSNRMAKHRTDAKASNHKQRKVYQKMNAFGIEHFKIVLIENHPCDSREELTRREDYYIRQMKPSLNTVMAFHNVLCARSHTSKQRVVRK